MLNINIPYKTSGVYILISTINGKRYVGSSTNIKNKFKNT